MVNDIDPKFADLVTKVVKMWVVTPVILGVASGMLLGTIVPPDSDPETTKKVVVTAIDIDSSFTDLNDSDDDQDKSDDDDHHKERRGYKHIQ